MSDETDVRRCKSCGKRLIDEKLPFCRRCVLEGRNKAGKVTTFVGGLATAIFSAKALVENGSNNNNGQA